ncbi:HET-domain-containing protein, partial [Tothia fuscella]
TENQIDFTRVRNWLTECLEKHHQCKPDLESLAPNGASHPEVLKFRLLDLHQKCIVPASMHCRYLALSYVWGGVQGLRLTTINKNILFTPGGLDKVWQRLPRTIRDAIDCTIALHERYIWVDALCLIQNDLQDIEHGLRVMDLIYEGATLTIIAACCHQADDALPGVHPATRYPTQRLAEVRPGVTLAVHPYLEALLKHTTYTRRAWTYQEQHLSRRALFFIDNQIYFRCQNMNYSEDLWLGKRVHELSSPLLTLVANTKYPVNAYKSLLEQYTRRLLSNQSDVLAALQGVMRRFALKMKTDFFQGVPAAAFDSFMLFHSEPRSLLRRRKEFPSYSWAGWIGNIQFVQSLYEHISSSANSWLTEQTWIIWYKKSLLNTAHLVWEPKEIPHSNTVSQNDTGYRMRSGFPLAASLGLIDLTTLPTREEVGPPLRGYPILKFWTLMVYLEIVEIKVFDATAVLIDTSQNECGIAGLDDFEADTFFETGQAYEFIVLSRCALHHKSDLVFPLKWPREDCYHALVLQMEDGVYERRGFGFLHKAGFANSLKPGPVWKEISLA